MPSNQGPTLQPDRPYERLSPEGKERVLRAMRLVQEAEQRYQQATGAIDAARPAGAGTLTDESSSMLPPRRKEGAHFVVPVTAHHRFMLRLHLDQVDALEAAIARIDQEVDSNVEPFRGAIEMLSTIPGLSRLSAEVIGSEIGINMNRFPTEGHLISWAGLCPKNDERAGKRRSNRMKKGAPWLKTTLIQCAWAASRTKGSYLQAQYLRLRSRRGPKRAIGAVAASILTAAYHMLKNGIVYQELGANHFDNRARDKQVLRLVNRLQNLGFAVQITPMAA